MNRRFSNSPDAVSLRLLLGLAEEIRGPLANLLAMNRSLLETNLNAPQRRYAEKVQAAGDTLFTVTNDILDYPRRESGRRILEQIDFDLRTTMEAALAALKPRARERGLEMACLVHHQVPSLLSGDPGRLRHVLIQMADLAMRATEKGELLIQVTVDEETPRQAGIHFAVMNTGRPIPKSRQRALFEFPFPPLPAGRARGTIPEIGLAVSAKLVAMMGGRMGIESRRGQGSTFWFTAKFRKQPPAKQAPRMAPGKIAGHPILVVDDNSTERQALCEELRAWGCVPGEAGGGPEALEKMRQARAAKSPFTAAILKKEMWEMDGIALGRRVKKDARLSSTLLVLLTSQGSRGDGRRVQEIGFDAYLTKPVKSSQIRDALALIINRRNARRGSAKLPLITRYSLEEEKRRGVRILLAGSDSRIQKLGLQILQKIGYLADIAVNGRDVLSALEKTSYDLLFLDADLPVMDGFRTASSIRRKEKMAGGHLPIIGLTAGTARAERERCLESGMDDYICKPIQAIEIADVMDRFASR